MDTESLLKSLKEHKAKFSDTFNSCARSALSRADGQESRTRIYPALTAANQEAAGMTKLMIQLIGLGAGSL